MARWFNIGGPCNPAQNYMLPAMGRLPDVAPLLRKGQYFVVHAQRQCGKTTAFLSLANETNAKGEAVAIYCSLETVQGFPRAEDGIPMICACLRKDAWGIPGVDRFAEERWPITDMPRDEVVSSGIQLILSRYAEIVRKPLYVFFDEVDCLGGETLITFLRQLRNGKIDMGKGKPFPASVALIGMRDIRDYKAKSRPESETLGSASPFNVVTEAMTIRTFSDEEVAVLYAQHTAETGQVFEPEAIRHACVSSGGQPYLVNALARWCVEKIHHEDFSQPITFADMDEAKEKIIRERGTHLDSLMERMKEPRVRRVVEPVMLGDMVNFDELQDDVRLVLDMGILKMDGRVLKPANPMYAEIIGRYLSWGTQQAMGVTVPETPWVKDDGLDMPGLLAAFQDFWRENASEAAVPFQYREAYPHLVLQAFLQRVINGGGQIVREMALGSERLDLGVHFRGAVYAVEVKKLAFYRKSPEKAYRQILGYMDRLGVSEGWLVVFDPDLAKSWNEKIGAEDVVQDGKTIHVIHC
ncbi:MAG: ATP-binding protein [bacterium]|nr:ATP-binding protein [bacterium]